MSHPQCAPTVCATFLLSSRLSTQSAVCIQKSYQYFNTAVKAAAMKCVYSFWHNVHCLRWGLQHQDQRSRLRSRCSNGSYCKLTGPIAGRLESVLGPFMITFCMNFVLNLIWIQTVPVHPLCRRHNFGYTPYWLRHVGWNSEICKN